MTWNTIRAGGTPQTPFGEAGEPRHPTRCAADPSLLDEWVIDLDFVDEHLALGREEVLSRLQADRYRLIEDTIGELESWAGFQPPVRQQPIVKRKKVGRNEPCPCGSGRKYKKCCGT